MTNKKRVLILGGTADAAALTAKIDRIVDAIASFAGRTRQPVTLRNPVSIRRGGFGGATGLANYLRSEQIDLLIDATHPFAAKISFNAAKAASECGIPRLMLIRPHWEALPGDKWIEVESHQGAANALPGLAQRIFLTIGRQELSAYAHLKDIWFLMRMIDSPEANAPIPPGKLLWQRGPFSLEEERDILQQYEISAIVSKNSGGDATYPKIIAARELGLPVVMIKRPPNPGGEQVADVNSALAWLEKNSCC
jgi:precorrin-6A/cobalt-precorrin-6A reductase